MTKWVDVIVDFLTRSSADPLIDRPLGASTTVDGDDSPLTPAQQTARLHLQLLGLGLLGVVAAPAAYAAFGAKKRRKRGLTKREERIGVSLENSSQQATGVLMTALAAPAISTAVAYILIQKLEDGRLITKGLGDAAQTILTVAAAGPMIQGIGSIATSAFKKGK